MDATALSTISGSSSDLASIVDDTSILTTSSYNVQITGTSTAAQIAKVDGDTTGVISVFNISDTLGNIASLNTSAATIIQNASGSVTAVGTNNNDSADFSTVLRSMVIVGNDGADSITGTDFGDEINGGAGVDSLFGRGGNDVFTFATGDSTTALVGSLAYDKIGDFSTVDDKIDLQVTPVLGAAESRSTTLGGVAGTVEINAAGQITFSGDGFNDATMSELLAAARSVVSGAGEVGYFEFNDGLNGNGTFIFQENGASANDMLILLGGVTGITGISGNAGGANTVWIV